MLRPLTDPALDSLMNEVLKEAPRGSRIPSLSHYQTTDGIVSFVKDIIKVANIAPYQEEVLQQFAIKQRVSVRAPHGTEKRLHGVFYVAGNIQAGRDNKLASGQHRVNADKQTKDEWTAADG